MKFRAVTAGSNANRRNCDSRRARSVRITAASPVELEDSQKDEKELEVFIETKQKELEEWKAEETEKNHVLEKIRLEESSLEQQNHFLQENISRLENEIEAYHRESEEITENLSRSAEEIHKKEDGIEELKKAVTECTGKEEVLDARRIEWQEEKEKRSTSHKSFFEKEGSSL